MFLIHHLPNISSIIEQISDVNLNASRAKGRAWDMSSNDERRQRGLDVYKKMGWGENEGVKELDPDLWAYTTDFLFGDVWARPGLSLREKELITIGVLMASKAEGMAIHMRNAHHLGITFAEIKEVILQSTYYLGMPTGLFAMRKLKAVMAETGATFEK
jgi:4-carboxymuconolactone decarboxylase